MKEVKSSLRDPIYTVFKIDEAAKRRKNHKK